MINLFLRRSMSQSIISKIINNAEMAEKRLAELKSKLKDVRKIKVDEHVRQLTQENRILAAKVEKAKAELIKIETLNGKRQYSIPVRTTIASETDKAPVPKGTNNESEQPAAKKEKKEKDSSKKSKASATSVTEGEVTVGKLDFRIGKIVEINKHPDADSLYVEKIDCGEEKPRTVVSGLVNHVPISEMQDKIVMVLCNLKPVKMRGVTSEAMVMCASSPEKVEVLIPPSGALPGDLVSCDGYPREPEPQLNPKKKIFETCAPDLKTNAEKIACYKGTPLTVPGKGSITAPTLKDVNVK